jgi:hypothetical protein
MNRLMKITDTSSGLAQSLLTELLHYDPLTGIFTWKVARSNNVKAKVGAIAGHVNRQGYRDIWIGERNYRACRLAWLYMTGEWPTSVIDHKNLLCGDDRWENLREATQAQNCANRRGHCNSKSGIKGVSFDKQVQKWYACVKINGKTKSLGRYSDKEEAARVYAAALKELYGSFARADEMEYVS